MNANRLLHCSGLHCANLVYFDESVDGRLFEQPGPGRYCPECAHLAGYFMPDDLVLLEKLLIEAGLYTSPHVQIVHKFSMPKPRGEAAPPLL